MSDIPDEPCLTEMPPGYAEPGDEVAFTIDGREVRAPEGQSVLPAALAAGIDVPYYCWHPDLTVAANCRMCMVEVETGRGVQLTTSCSLPVQEDIEVRTDTEEVREARRDVMEYLLLNHPLDCPVCDQAGECALQEYAYRHGRDHGRTSLEEKVHKHTKNMGPTVALWGERCIQCTRCVRVTEEITGTGELTMTQRGDHTVPDVFPGFPLQGPMAGNVVDVCPVGALVSRDFLFKGRSWYLQPQTSICAECPKGCNIQVETQWEEPKRIRPRPNYAVNRHWMCDIGRNAYAATVASSRLESHAVLDDGELRSCGFVEALRETVRALGEAEGEVAVLVSGQATVEEAFLARRVADVLGDGPVAAVLRPDGAAYDYPRFAIPKERTGNLEGLRRVLGDEAVEDGAAREACRADGVSTVLVCGGLTDTDIPDELAGALAERTVCAMVFDEGQVPDGARAVLAGASPLEREGVYVNEDGRAQLLREATPPSGHALADLEILQELLRELGEGEEAPPRSAAAVFGDVAGELEAFEGLDHRAIGERGTPLDGEDEGPHPMESVQNIPGFVLSDAENAAGPTPFNPAGSLQRSARDLAVPDGEEGEVDASPVEGDGGSEE